MRISRRSFMKAVGAGALTAAGTGVYAKGTTNWLETTEVTLGLKNWTRDGFKVAYLSDTHLTDDASIDRAQRAFEFAASHKPDILVFGGDFVESSKSNALGRMQKVFGDVAKLGIPAYAVLGNHDYATDHPEKVVRKAQQLGFKVLRNEAVEVKGITVVGLDCLTFNKTNVAALKPHVGKENVLVLLHEPDGVDLLDHGPSLMLAGHSHGGQICLPTGIPLHTPLGARNYYSGYYPESKVPLYVCRGIGVTGLRVRLFCRPEATVLTLNRA